MFINTTVVQALMALRDIDETTLANVAFVSPKRLREWLNGEGEKADDKIAFERQLEVLRTLGIHNETPRGDVVHHWHVREPLFGSARRIYWALQAMVEAFGRAQVVFLSREADPALTLRNEARFVLKFDSFRAVLHIEGHPMRSLRFRPESFSGLEWMPGSYGVLLDESEYEALAPGLVETKVLEGHLHAGADAFHWERLTHLAREANVSAEQLLSWVTGAGTAQLPSSQPAVRARAVIEPTTVPEAQPPSARLRRRETRQAADRDAPRAETHRTTTRPGNPLPEAADGALATPAGFRVRRRRLLEAQARAGLPADVRTAAASLTAGGDSALAARKTNV